MEMDNERSPGTAKAIIASLITGVAAAKNDGGLRWPFLLPTFSMSAFIM